MADRDDAGLAQQPLPEFRVIVRHPNKRGPLGPYRLLITVAAVLLVLGQPLWNSLLAGDPSDALLLRIAGLGLLVWITTGIVSRALAQATDPIPTTSLTAEPGAAAPGLADDD